MDVEHARRVGRPRSDVTRVAILDATVDLIERRGYACVTVEGIARQARAGKQTIYRWWPSKTDIVVEALAAKAGVSVPIDDRGSFAADLDAFVRTTFREARRPVVGELLRALMAEALANPAFGERFRAGFLQRRRDALRLVIGRARARGDGPRLPESLAVDVVFGVLWYRLLDRHDEIDDDLVDQLVAMLSSAAR